MKLEDWKTIQQAIQEYEHVRGILNVLTNYEVEAALTYSIPIRIGDSSTNTVFIESMWMREALEKQQQGLHDLLEYYGVEA